MADYIERKTLIEKLCSITLNIFGIRMGKTILYQVLDAYRKAVLTTIEEAPAADVVEVKHGEWLEIDDGVSIGNGKHLECSECGVWKQNRQRSNYCPNCGAKMDGERKDHERTD